MNASRRVWAGLGAVLAMVVFVPAASAAITPTMTLTQSGTQAGSSVALTTDIAFAPSSPSTDSVKDLTEILPPGLLSNASIDGGVCLKTPAPSSGLPAAACQIGTGTSTVVANGALTETATLSLYLVAPPQTSDLAGIVIYEKIGMGAESQLGSPGDVSVRPSGDPNGVGLDISFTNIPDTISFGGPPLSLSVKDLDTTITAIRMPTSCPSPAANYAIQADSYSDPTTTTTASAPLNVTGCSGLELTPTFAVTATRDTADAGVQVTTDLQQPAASNQATSSTVVLTLPPNVLGANAGAVVSGGILCTDPTFASCVTIGTAMTTSPLYPTALQGKAYLTGSLTAPAIALVFPPPFPIMLSGAVNLATGSTTFTGVPDIPLTDLQVVLAGGPDSVFTPSCNPASGTASAALTSQDGDQTATANAPFTVSNCPPPSGGGGGSGGGGSSPPVTTPPVSSPPHMGRPQLRSVRLSKLAHGRFLLRVGLVAGTNSPALKSVQIGLPAGLRLASPAGHRLQLRKRIFTRNASIGLVKLIASVKLVHGRILVALRRSARHVTVSIRGLTAAVVGHAARRHPRRRLKVVVSARDAAGTLTRFAARTLHVRVA